MLRYRLKYSSLFSGGSGSFCQEITDYTDIANPGNTELTITGGVAPYAYAWYNGGTTNPLENLEVGTYECTITDRKGCVLIVQDLVVEQMTGTAALSDVRVRLYPNPARGWVVYLEGDLRVERIAIYSVEGRLLREQQGVDGSGAVDIQGLDGGVYWVRLIVGGSEMVLRILVG